MNRFRELINLTSPFAFSIAFRMLGDEEDARDVVQDAMVIIWQKIGKIKSAGAYKTWVYRIVTNRCCDLLRQDKKNPVTGQDEKAWALISETISDTNVLKFENEELAAIIRVLTERLSPRQKTVFVLSEIEQLSAIEISEITGMSRTSIKSNLCIARKNISEMLEIYVR